MLIDEHQFISFFLFPKKTKQNTVLKEIWRYRRELVNLDQMQ